MSVEECILLTEEYPNYKSCLPCHHTQVLINTSNSTTRAAAHRRRRQASAGPWSSILLEWRQETRRPFCIKVAYPSVRIYEAYNNALHPLAPSLHISSHRHGPSHRAKRWHSSSQGFTATLDSANGTKNDKKRKGANGRHHSPCAYGNKNHSEISQNHEAVLLLQRDLKGGQASKVLRT